MTYVLPADREDVREGAVFDARGTASSEVVFIKDGDLITYIARGKRKGGKLTLLEVRALVKPIQTMRFPMNVPARLKGHAIRVFNGGGNLPPKTAKACIDTLVFLVPELRSFVEN